MKKIQTDVEYAVPGLMRIFASMVYDCFLLAAISIAYGALVVGLRVLILGQPEVGQRIHWDMFSSILITLGWLSLLMYFYVFFWHKFGQTLGMKTWRLQLVDAQTNRLPNYQQCIKRSFFALLSLLLFGLGYWYRFVNPQQRLAHDLLSETKLILLKKK